MDEPVPADRSGPRPRRRHGWLPPLVAAALLGALPGAGGLAAPAWGEAAVRADGPIEEQPDDAGDVAVTGSGFGHGVGMSQYGARGMALDGSSARAILTHYYTGTTVTGVPDDVDLRVNVVDRGTAVTLATSALATGGGAVQLVTGGGKVVNVAAGGKVVVQVEGSSLRATVTPREGSATAVTTSVLTVRWSGARALAGPASVLKVTSRSANATSTSSKVRSYRWGALRLTPVVRTDSDQVNRTRIEAMAILNLHREYLRGIAEVPSSWPSAALQAQAIAARNFALGAYRGGTSATCGGCHLWDDTRSQVYRGWDVESVAPRWVAAVGATQTSSTSGLAVLYDGRPITAYYSSSSGGRTRNSENVWTAALPYLRGVDDPWSVDPAVNPSYAKWEREVPRARLAAVFGLDDLASIEVTKTDGSGAAVTVTATSQDGTEKSVSGATVRSKLGLPAPWFSEFKLDESS